MGVTVALGVVAGVAVVVMAVSLLAWRSSSKRLAGAGGKLAEAEDELVRSRDSEEAARREVADERRRAGEAEARAVEADQRAARSETRASSAEAAMEALLAARSPAVLAEIERVRLEREWKEVSGPDAQLPVRWDGSLGVAIEIELEVIREVTGTPGRLEIGDAGPGGAGAPGLDDTVDEAKLWMLGSLACELLRVVARYADEMVVRLDHGPAMAPALAATASGARSLPDLTSVEMAAKALGVSVSVEQTGDGFAVRLSAG